MGSAVMSDVGRGCVLGNRTRSRVNNFDLVRLVAAALVVVSHCWSLTGRAEPRIFGNSFGGLGVAIFFAVSGFLIARSWDLDPRPHAYLFKRILRLWPALTAVLLVCAVVVVPVTSAGRLAWADAAHYVFSNLLLQTQHGITGAFAGNPAPESVTGTLWTLPVELKAYAMLLVLALAGMTRRPMMLCALLVVFAWVLHSPADYQHSAVGQWLDAPVQAYLLMVFFGGSLLYALRDRVPLDWRLTVVAAVVFATAPQFPGGLRPLLLALALPYLVLVAAYATPAALRRLTAPGDVSYGLYLWAFPVQQIVIHAAGGSLAPLWVLVATFPISYAVALCSWRLIEAPSLRLKGRLHSKRAAAPRAAAAGYQPA
jgi:peptidoglycan/LPS O-acetylase OafA/YrhL